MVTTFYERLGVSEDATTEEIRAAYRDRIKETHPDLNEGADAEEATRAVIRAKEVLTDETERGRYDRLGHEDYLHRTNGAKPDVDSQDVAEAGRHGTDVDGDGNSAAAGSGAGGRAGAPGGRSTSTGSTGSGRAAGTGTTDRSASSSGRPNWTDTRNPYRKGPWEPWQTRQASPEATTYSGYSSRLFPTEQSVVLIVLTTLFYPVLIASTVFPPFPLLINVIVGICVLLTVGYLLSVPEIGVVVFGFWSVVGTLGMVLLPGVTALSVVGLVLVVTTWAPLGVALLTLAVTYSSV
jgi:curved DNA-binding protein CbpA